MRPHVAFAVLAVAVVMLAPAHAQWLTYPTAGIPRTADGKPRMDGDSEVRKARLPKPEVGDRKMDPSKVEPDSRKPGARDRLLCVR